MRQVGEQIVSIVSDVPHQIHHVREGLNHIVKSDIKTDPPGEHIEEHRDVYSVDVNVEQAPQFSLHTDVLYVRCCIGDSVV